MYPPLPKKDEVDLVFFHRNCADGFGAALCVYYFYKLCNLQQPTYAPVSYIQDDNRTIAYLPDVTGRNIAILDFSFSANVMKKHILPKCKSLVLLDHHKSAQENLADIPNCKIDMDHSGAWLAWTHWFGGLAPPRLIEYLQDRDLWKFELPDSRFFTLGLFIEKPMDFDEWERILLRFEDYFKPLVDSGKSYKKYQDGIIEKRAKYAKTRLFCDKKAAVVNCSFFISEMGEELLRLHSDCELAIVWHWDDYREEYKLHLRSRSGSSCNVSELAQRFGGGGHEASAAFSVKIDRSIVFWFATTNKKRPASPPRYVHRVMVKPPIKN
jgi:oligoribonuclease NrnB/cAMP/cGMP phosphodiesterase (DHH superfamily)